MQSRSAMKRSDTSIVRHQPPSVPSEPDVDALVEDLRKIYCAAGTVLMVSVGKLVLERIYGGDVERWRSRGRKNASFRNLSKHPRLPFSRANLSRAVGIYVLSLRRPEVLELRGVGPCHLREIIRLDADTQDDLLAQTVQNEWSVRRLHNEICEIKKAGTSGASGSTGVAFADLLQTWRAAVEARGLLQDVDRVDRLDPAEAAVLLETAKRLAQQAETLVRHLARRAVTRPPPATDVPSVMPVPNRPSGIVSTVATWRPPRLAAARGKRGCGQDR
jgi:hypothetical protein